MFHICRTIRPHFSLHQVKLCIGQRKYKQKFTTQGRKDRLTDRSTKRVNSRSLTNSYFAFCKIVVKRQEIMEIYIKSSQNAYKNLLLHDFSAILQYWLNTGLTQKYWFFSQTYKKCDECHGKSSIWKTKISAEMDKKLLKVSAPDRNLLLELNL